MGQVFFIFYFSNMDIGKVEAFIIDKIREFAYVQGGVITSDYFSYGEKQILRSMQLIFYLLNA